MNLKSGKGKIYGIGVDIERIERFKKKPFNSHEKFYKKLFSDSEIEYCLRHKNPYPNFAARFCAKEALWKAISGDINITWHDIEVLNGENGKPYFNIITEDITKTDYFSNVTVSLSVSHDPETAAAFVVVQEK